MKQLISIDPGQSGGIATLCGDIVQAYKMPEGMTAQCDWLRARKLTGYTMAIIERVGGYMPGNSGPAAVKFADHCGALNAALYCHEFSTEKVAPTTWQAHLNLPKPPAIPKDLPADERRRELARRKTERKNAIKEQMQRRFPHLDVTLATADALGMLVWAMETKGGVA